MDDTIKLTESLGYNIYHHHAQNKINKIKKFVGLTIEGVKIKKKKNIIVVTSVFGIEIDVTNIRVIIYPKCLYRNKAVSNYFGKDLGAKFWLQRAISNCF